jgi:hypothetical protein
MRGFHTTHHSGLNITVNYAGKIALIEGDWQAYSLKY